MSEEVGAFTSEAQDAIKVALLIFSFICTLHTTTQTIEYNLIHMIASAIARDVQQIGHHVHAVWHKQVVHADNPAYQC